jgi:tripartite-type tricarboxylate transporter receptor subunit TctC
MVRIKCRMAAMLAAGAVSTFAAGAQAQESYPSRPIRIIVPYNAGGAGDIMARAIGKAIGAKLKQSVIVENRAGASGMIGTSIVARAKGDPYTLLLGSSAEMSINPHLYANVSYSPEQDFIPVAFAGKLPLVLVANPSVPADTLKGLIELARRKPDSLSFGSAGVGQTAHLGLEMIIKQTGVKMIHVPYKGGSEAVMGVVSDQVQLFLSGLPPSLPQIKSGKLRALAVSTRERVPQLPDVPTVAESGVQGFDIYNWFAVFAPADTPADIVATLNEAIDEAVQSPQLQEVWQAQGIVAQLMPPGALKDFVASESRKYKELIKTTQVKAE